MYTACSPALFSDSRFESLRSGITAERDVKITSKIRKENLDGN